MVSLYSYIGSGLSLHRALTSWRNSVRFSLSIMPPKGRKRKAEVEGPKDSGEGGDQPVAEPPPAKRGRGRPKKEQATASKGGEAKRGAEGEGEPPPAKKERGTASKGGEAKRGAEGEGEPPPAKKERGTASKGGVAKRGAEGEGEPPPAKKERGTASKGGEAKRGAEGEGKPPPAKKERGTASKGGVAKRGAEGEGEPPPAKKERGTASKGGVVKRGAEGEGEPPPAKKERGKPKKVEEKPLAEETTDSGQSETNKKGPGRPKKGKSTTDGGEAAPKPKTSNVTDWSRVDLSKWSNLGTTKDGRPWTKKFSSWNVNGIRAWMKNGGLEYIKNEEPDIFTLQECKCADADLPKAELEVPGYHVYWYSAEKKGYSGTGLYSKVKPLNVTFGMGIEKHDKEGRLITAEFDDFYFITTYVPNAGEGLKRLDYRQVWDVDFRAYLKRLDAVKPVILTGDLNVAHEEIDLANPKTNKNTAGFTKEEREGFSALLAEGFLDCFRLLYPEKVTYSYWSYRSNARARNMGWRLDYFVISERLRKDLCDCVTRTEVYGSDHCPHVLGLALN